MLGFPFIFRGALDVRASKINEEMKMAAVKALAALAKEPVPEQVNVAYGQTRLAFGRNYIIPKPFDPRLIAEIPPAVAKAALESGVAKEAITDWEKYKDILRERLGSDNKLVRLLLSRAKLSPKRVVFAEADQLAVLKAAQIAYEEGIAIPVLLGRKDTIEALMAEIDFEGDIDIIDPKTDEENNRKNRYAKVYWEQRKRRGVTLYAAQRLMRERNYFAAMMVNEGDADALISGYSRNYPSVVKPMLELIGKANGVTRIATTNVMMTKRGPMFLSDTSINIDPTAKDLAKIAVMTSKVIKTFGFEPVIAMTSYSNFGSSDNEKASKVREAVSILHRNYPELVVDGDYKPILR
ncbi:NADP-dependent malic enzyme [Jejuia pallidilutea]|uniref:NADP-dependent malic enzyme n=1 Tax=Jejuia pallidilutea TaxID=504487 RepID=A0A090VMF7_9FLAO|nr:NADP-dependent malic enzyme [Jejuia pallidilutea]